LNYARSRLNAPDLAETAGYAKSLEELAA